MCLIHTGHSCQSQSTVHTGECVQPFFAWGQQQSNDLWTDLQTEDIKAYILLFYCSPKRSWSYFRDTEDFDTDLGKKQNTPQKNNVLARYKGDLTLASI